MAEQIGTAYISVTVDADQMQAGLSTARRSVADLSTQAQAEFNKLSASQKRAAESALNYAGNIGKTRAEVRAFNAEQRIGGTLGKEIAATIRAQDAAYRSMAASASMAANGLGSSALSASELRFATRQLPMQFTDIATSLAAGQAPLMVLLQQGGQLKDTFGGAGAAMRAMGGYVMGLINPVTILAAAAGTLALAWQQSEDRMASLNRALILTGGNAGMTAGQLAQLAAEMDELEGVTTGSATKALAAVAETGRFTAEQIELVATAAENLRAAGVANIDETIAKFVELGKDPVDALLKLNETEHFLTETQIRRIRELVEEGKAQEAATEAMRIYADVVTERSREVIETLGGIRGMWHDIKVSATEAWDAVVNGANDADRAIALVQTRMGVLRSGQSDFVNGWIDQLSAMATAFGPLGFMVDRMVRGGGGAFAGVSSSTQSTLDEGLYTPADFSGVTSRSQTSNFEKDRQDARRRAQREAQRAAEEAKRERYRAAKEEIDRQREAEDSLRKLIATEEEANRKYLDLAATLSGPLAAAEYQHQRNLEEIDRLGKEAGRTSAEIAELKRLEGEAYEEVVEKIKRQSNEMSQFTEQAARNMQSAFADFLFDPFEDGLDGMLESFAKTLQRMAAEAAAAQIFNAIGNYGKQNTGTWWGDLLSSFVTNANGGVYSRGLESFEGGVYNTPQFFAFAKGAGVFAEAGPEAIMPLSRGPDGKLGVTASGASPEVNVNIYNASEGADVQQRQNANGVIDIDVIFKQIEGSIASNVAQGASPLNSAMQGRYNLRPAV